MKLGAKREKFIIVRVQFGLPSIDIEGAIGTGNVRSREAIFFGIGRDIARVGNIGNVRNARSAGCKDVGCVTEGTKQNA